MVDHLVRPAGDVTRIWSISHPFESGLYLHGPFRFLKEIIDIQDQEQFALCETGLEELLL